MRQWTKKDATYLKKHYRKKTNEELAHDLKCDVTTIQVQLRTHGLGERIKGDRQILPSRIREIDKTTLTEEKKLYSKTYSKALKLYERGIKEFQKERYKEAEPFFQQVLDEYPDEIEMGAQARKYLAICSQKTATRTEKKPSGVRELYARGVLLMNEEDYQTAIKYLEDARKRQPKDDAILYTLATAYSLIEEEQRALDYLEKAIKLNAANRVYAKSEIDFDKLREKEEFRQLVTPSE